MKLFVLGNISSGKSYIIENIKKILPNYNILKIDDYRIKHSSGSLEDELKLWEEFPQEVLKYEDVIVELSGGGKVSENILSRLEKNSFLVIKVNTSVELCLERNKDKDFSKIPYPREFNEPIEETIKRIGSMMLEGFIEKQWNEAINIIDIPSSFDVAGLPLMQYHELFKLKNALNEFEGSLFTFGSTGRGLMKNTSDVDVYFFTNANKDAIYNKLSNIFDEARIMADEFVIRDNGILVEINYIKDIKQAYLFYNRSLITNPSKTILKDDYKIYDNLVEAANEEFDIKKEIDFTIERLNYYVESLPMLIKKNDEYKYYFHNNIIVHEYVKLKAFINGVFEFSYLPLNAKKYLTDEEWKNILYYFGDDQLKHYEIVKGMSQKIIEEIQNIY